LECGDSSPLSFSAVAWSLLRWRAPSHRESKSGKSGDESPHSKDCTSQDTLTQKGWQMMTPLAILVLSFASPGHDTKPADYPRADLLIDAAELARPEASKRFMIFDTRGKEKYEAGHVPGSIWIDVPEWNKSFAAGPDRSAWQARLGRLGITEETPVVVYGDDAREYARIWWILRYWGVRDVRLLNGGWEAWQSAGAPVSKETPPARDAASVSLVPQQGRLATKDQVLAHVKARDIQIVDARSEKEHCGETTTAKRNGSIPDARHLEWLRVLDPATQRFKSPTEIAGLLKEVGIDPHKPAITYCQSGGRAAVMAFTLELMGGAEVRNYYKSWSEWGNSDDTPVIKPGKQ